MDWGAFELGSIWTREHLGRGAFGHGEHLVGEHLGWRAFGFGEHLDGEHLAGSILPRIKLMRVRNLQPTILNVCVVLRGFIWGNLST